MPAALALSQFALDVAEGLSRVPQKKLSPRYFYDDLGSILFEAITLLPEYGLTRADEKLLQTHADEIAMATGPLSIVAELGSGSGTKTRHILQALSRPGKRLLYQPVDLSARALAACELELGKCCEVRPICSDWMEGVADVIRGRNNNGPVLLLFLGSSIGNLERAEILQFLRRLNRYLSPGDFLLLGADLVKDLDRMIAAYDDPTGITAAFNLNLLGRMNRELDADFDLRSFAHEVRWNEAQRRIEMHLLSGRDQTVSIRALDARFEFLAGETIWTESSHKFTEPELHRYALASGFDRICTWVDKEWPFAETLWQVAQRA